MVVVLLSMQVRKLSDERGFLQGLEQHEGEYNLHLITFN